jgi:c(7)-type cytochrome triheme protein
MSKIFAFMAGLVLSAAFVSASYADSIKAGEPYPGDLHYGKTGQPVVFSHKAHVGDFSLECEACHTKIFELKAGAATAKGDFTMESLNAGRYCGSCHNGKTAFSTDDYEHCASCHLENPGAAGEETHTNVVGPREDIPLGSDDSVALFKHPAHDALACSECHTALFPMKKTKTITTMDDINAKKSCGSCHDGKRAFEPSDCGKCHPKM